MAQEQEHPPCAGGKVCSALKLVLRASETCRSRTDVRAGVVAMSLRRKRRQGLANTKPPAQLPVEALACGGIDE